MSLGIIWRICLNTDPWARPPSEILIRRSEVGPRICILTHSPGDANAGGSRTVPVACSLRKHFCKPFSRTLIFWSSLMTSEKQQKRQKLLTHLGRTLLTLETMYSSYILLLPEGKVLPIAAPCSSAAILMHRTLPDIWSVVQTEACRACEWVWANNSKLCTNCKGRA